MRAHKRQPLLNDEKRKRCVNGVRVCADNTADWVKYSRPKWIEPNFIIFVTHFRYYLPFEKSHRLKCEFVPNLCSIFDTKQHTHTHEHTHSAFVARSQYISIFIMHHKILLIHFHFRMVVWMRTVPIIFRLFWIGILHERYICVLYSLVTLNMNIGHVVYIPFAWYWTPHRDQQKPRRFIWTSLFPCYYECCYDEILSTKLTYLCYYIKNYFSCQCFFFLFHSLVDEIFIAILSMLVKFINYTQCILCWVFKILTAIFRDDNVVYRPANICSLAIHFMEISFANEKHLRAVELTLIESEWFDL